MRYVYPPRPLPAIHPDNLDRLEREKSWLAQYKYNGSRTGVYIRSGKIALWNRHHEEHIYFVPPQLADSISSLNLDSSKDYILDGELLHSKTKNLKNTLVLFDVLWAGEYLFGVSQPERLKILCDICRNPIELEERGRALLVGEGLWLAEVWDGEFVFHFYEKTELDEIEGLILRRKNSQLDNLGQQNYVANWMLRSRKSHKGSTYQW
jgi:ATP-dependent DNA ligase